MPTDFRWHSLCNTPLDPLEKQHQPSPSTTSCAATMRGVGVGTSESFYRHWKIPVYAKIIPADDVVHIGKRRRSHDSEGIKKSQRKLPFAAPLESPFPAEDVLSVECGSVDFKSLPEEVVFQILSFLGPASQSLVSLACVNRRYRNIMGTIGDAMMKKAQQCFQFSRISDRPSYQSSISLFVHYSQRCQYINDRLIQLQGILDKNFEYEALPSDTAFQYNSPLLSDSSHNKVTPITQPHAKQAPRLDVALDISVELMLLFSNSLSSDNTLCSTTLETRLLVLVGKCGGKAFKYSKAKLQAHMNAISGTADTLHQEQDSGSSLKRQETTSVLYERLDRARLVMQQVLFHKLLMGRKRGMLST